MYNRLSSHQGAWFIALMLIGNLLLALPAMAQEINDQCVLTKPIRAGKKQSGKGPQVWMGKGTTVSVLATFPRRINVQWKGKSLFPKRQQLENNCQQVTAAALIHEPKEKALDSPLVEQSTEVPIIPTAAQESLPLIEKNKAETIASPTQDLLLITEKENEISNSEVSLPLVSTDTSNDPWDFLSPIEETVIQEPKPKAWSTDLQLITSLSAQNSNAKSFIHQDLDVQSKNLAGLVIANTQLGWTRSFEVNDTWNTRLSIHVDILLGMALEKDRDLEVIKTNQSRLQLATLSLENRFGEIVSLSNAGLIRVDTGPGLSFHPAYSLPINGWSWDSRRPPWEQVNPVGVEQVFFLPHAIQLYGRYFPFLESKYSDALLGYDQTAAYQAGLATNFNDKLFIDATINRNSNTWFSMSLEWIGETTNWFTEIGVKHGARTAIWKTTPQGIQPDDRSNKTWLRLSAGPEFDFDGGKLGQLRLSLEYIYDQDGLTAKKNEAYAQVIESLTGQGTAQAAQNLGAIASENWNPLELYRHRALVRLASLTGAEIQWDLNFMALYPLDGLLITGSLSTNIGEKSNLGVRCETGLAKSMTLFAQLPLGVQCAIDFTMNL